MLKSLAMALRVMATWLIMYMPMQKKKKKNIMDEKNNTVRNIFVNKKTYGGDGHKGYCARPS